MVDLGDLLELDSCKLHFPNCMCCKRCWNGWLARMWQLFFRGGLSKTYTSYLLVDLDDSPFLAKISEKNWFLKYMCRHQWLTWLTCWVLPTYSRKRFDFWKYRCCNCWLTWVTCQVSQRFSARASTFENMYVVNSGWLGWLVESRKKFLRGVHFWIICML